MYQVVVIEHKKKHIVLETKDLNRAVEIAKIYRQKKLHTYVFNKLDIDKQLGKEH